MQSENKMGEVFRAFLQEEYMLRKKRNSMMSLRAFAMYLQMAPGRLSEYMSGRRVPSSRTIMKLMTRLGADSQRCLDIIEADARFDTAGSSKETIKYLELREDQFKLLAGWEHFAILSLVETSDFDDRPSKIAQRLGISAIEARSVFERLQRMGFIHKNNQNKWCPSQPGLKTTEDVSSSALRESHRQSINQALQCLETVDPKQRDISSRTMAINSKKISAAKKLIRKFRDDISNLLEKGSRDEVYNINIQLVPVTKIKSRRNL